MKLNQVTFPSMDINKSLLFYKKLGFTPIVITDHYCRFESAIDPVNSATFSIEKVAEPIIKTAKVKVYFEFENKSRLQEKVDALIAQGLTVSQVFG